MAKWIVSNFPAHGSWSHYGEPYYGGGAVHWLLYPFGISEAVNDINYNLTSFFECLQDKDLFAEFDRRINMVPFSEVEFEKAGHTLLDPTASKLEKGLAYFIRNRQGRQGLGKDFATTTTRLRRDMNEQVSAWLSSVKGLPLAHARLIRTEIRNMDACDFIRMYDHPRAFFYCDPTYLPDTRTAKQAYQFEMTYEQHVALLDLLPTIQGKFMLSGYRSSLYDERAAAHGWRRIEKRIDNKASSKKVKDVKIECLYMNYTAA